MSDLRVEIVKIVSSFCKKNNLDYRDSWKQIYTTYGETYNIWPDIWYKFGSKSKLDFLENYENMCGTLTKLYNIIKQLK